MKNTWMVIFFAISLNIFSFQVLATEQCSIGTLKQVENKLDSLSLEDVNVLLQTLDKSCTKSAEFSEWSNELVFYALTKQPVLFTQSLETQPIDKQQFVASILESPVHDGINLQLAYTAVKNEVIDSKLKHKILAALQIAAGKYGATLK